MKDLENGRYRKEFYVAHLSEYVLRFRCTLLIKVV
jgi:hypothetical protein